MTQGPTPNTDTSLVEWIFVAVPDPASLSVIAASLDELVADGTIRLLDLVGVARDARSRQIAVLGQEFLDSTSRRVSDERIGSLLSDDDIELAAAALLPGSAGLIAVVEDRWAETLSSVATRSGGQIVGGERIPRARIEAALRQPPSEPDRSRPPATRGHGPPLPG